MKHETELPYFTFPTGGTTVHYELYEHGNKKERPTFVLIHGFLSSSFSYRHLIPLLTKEGTVIALDLPPFGKSDKSNHFTYSYHNLATIIIDLIEHLQLQNIVLVGHSMGGQISLYVNRLRPDLITKTILLCSSSYLTRANLPLIYSSYLPFFHLYVKNWIIRRGIVYNLMNVVHDHSLIDDEMMEGYAAPFYDNRIFPALTRMIRDREEIYHQLNYVKSKPQLYLSGAKKIALFRFTSVGAYTKTCQIPISFHTKIPDIYYPRKSRSMYLKKSSHFQHSKRLLHSGSNRLLESDTYIVFTIYITSL